MDDLDAMIDSLIPRRTSGRRFVAGLLLGMIGGAAAAALLMPRSGPALRTWLAERVQAWLGQARNTLAGEQLL
ncbi:YtxH domain-containing protein [Chloroflexus sp.]|uniref:YtxH domain-containing protein n=1 Tax=Chloroflexus sp. TaxID=1904827 RepID=UPI002ACD4028|nr:YtxH domain-containing protein [Chloroflexus sp.]